MLKDDRFEEGPTAAFSWKPAIGVAVLECEGDVVLATEAVVVVTVGVATVTAAEADDALLAVLVNVWNGFTYVNLDLGPG